MGNDESKSEANKKSESESTGDEKASGKDEKSTVAFDINKPQSNEDKTDENSSDEPKGKAFRVNKDQ